MATAKRGECDMRWNRMVPLIVLLTTVAVASGCGGKSAPNAGAVGSAPPAAKTSTAKQPIEGSHEERTYIKTGAHLSPYKAVYVAPPTMDTTADRNEKVDDFLKQLQANIRTASEGALRATGKFQLVTENERDARAKGKYLVYRNDVLVHFGSTAARWIVGMGAGRSKLIVVPSLEDPATKDIVLKYTGWGGSAAGLGFEVLNKMQADVFAIENYVGGLVRKVPN
jgi:hypothetical protein